MSMYDNQPYIKDPDLCSSDKIRLVSGNMIKYYNFHYVANEPYIVNTQDDIVKEKLAKMQRELARKSAILNEEMNQEEDTPAEATVGSENNS